MRGEMAPQVEVLASESIPGTYTGGTENWFSQVVL